MSDGVSPLHNHFGSFAFYLGGTVFFISYRVVVAFDQRRGGGSESAGADRISACDFPVLWIFSGVLYDSDCHIAASKDKIQTPEQNQFFFAK